MGSKFFKSGLYLAKFFKSGLGESGLDLGKSGLDLGKSGLELGKSGLDLVKFFKSELGKSGLDLGKSGLDLGKSGKCPCQFLSRSVLGEIFVRTCCSNPGLGGLRNKAKSKIGL